MRDASGIRWLRQLLSELQWLGRRRSKERRLLFIIISMSRQPNAEHSSPKAVALKINILLPVRPSYSAVDDCAFRLHPPISWRGSLHLFSFTPDSNRCSIGKNIFYWKKIEFFINFSQCDWIVLKNLLSGGQVWCMNLSLSKAQSRTRNICSWYIYHDALTIGMLDALCFMISFIFGRCRWERNVNLN